MKTIDEYKKELDKDGKIKGSIEILFYAMAKRIGVPADELSEYRFNNSLMLTLYKFEQSYEASHAKRKTDRGHNRWR